MARMWILVCDAARARIFSAEGDEEWKLVEELNHPESRETAHDELSDTSGRMQHIHTTGIRAQMRSAVPQRAYEAEKFVQLLAGRLKRGLEAKEYDSLAIAASPKVLGLLRDELHGEVQKRVRATIDKDFTHLRAEELADRVLGP